MDHVKHQQDLREARASTRKLGTAVSLLSLALLVSSVTTCAQMGNERTIIVPPTLERSFWVSSERVSAEYLEGMAGYFQWLILDVSPSTIDWKTREVLKYISPEFHGAMKTKMQVERDRLRAANSSTSFLLQSFQTDEKNQVVVITGRLRRQINSVDAGDPQTRSYRIAFKFKGGRVHVDSFEEVPHAANPQDVLRDKTAAISADGER